jgi:hypothetical protein
MRKSVLGFCVLVLLLMGLGPVPGHAQEGVVVVATVPFAFMVDNTMLPAGQYEFTQMYDQPWEWSVADAKGMVKVLFSTEPADMMNPPRAYEVTFDNVNGKYFLTNVWLSGDEDGFYVAMSRSEKALMKKGVKAKEERVPAKKK